MHVYLSFSADKTIERMNINTERDVRLSSTILVPSESDEKLLQEDGSNSNALRKSANSTNGTIAGVAGGGVGLGGTTANTNGNLNLGASKVQFSLSPPGFRPRVGESSTTALGIRTSAEEVPAPSKLMQSDKAR